MNKLIIRDCYQQVKTIHRLMLALQDDLGDAAANVRPGPVDDQSTRVRLEDFADKVCNAEAMFHGMREKLDLLSR